MMKTALVICLAMVIGVSAAQAEPIPDYVLEKDYTSCMGGETPQQDPARQQYCLCIRDSMKNWTLDEYGQVATEGAKAHEAGQEPAQLQDIAKQCIAKALPQH